MVFSKFLGERPSGGDKYSGTFRTESIGYLSWYFDFRKIILANSFESFFAHPDRWGDCLGVDSQNPVLVGLWTGVLCVNRNSPVCMACSQSISGLVEAFQSDEHLVKIRFNHIAAG